LIRCLDCMTVEVLPDLLASPTEMAHDPLLMRVVARHRGPLNRQQLAHRPPNAPRVRPFTTDLIPCDMCNQGGCAYCEGTGKLPKEPHRISEVFSVAPDDWASGDRRKVILRQLWADHPGYPEEFYASKDTFREDAGLCYERHNRPGDAAGPYACIDYHTDTKRLTDRHWKSRNPNRDHVWLCEFCLGGDTEVVTREGIRDIRSLSGTTPSLLIPRDDGYGGRRSSVGLFAPAPVRSFGVQSVWKIEMRRGTARKVISATADHRWVLLNGGQSFVTTKDLREGDLLRPLSAPKMPLDAQVPFATAQGFVYGDGNRPWEERPSSLTIYTDAKAKALLPYFSACEPTWNEHKNTWEIYGLPRSWKDLPSMSESRSFLLSWLSGYFAADGTVGSSGQATMTSADEASLRFCEGVAAVCGLRTTPIRYSMRVGFGTVPTPLYTLGITASSCPTWFFRIDEHRSRVERNMERSTYRQSRERNAWVVRSVSYAGEEEVFCATVEGQQAFGLAGGLMTGNCPFSSVVMQRKRSQAGQYDE